jgi:hypothetical protein
VASRKYVRWCFTSVTDADDLAQQFDGVVVGGSLEPEELGPTKRAGVCTFGHVLVIRMCALELGWMLRRQDVRFYGILPAARDGGRAHPRDRHHCIRYQMR